MADDYGKVRTEERLKIKIGEYHSDYYTATIFILPYLREVVCFFFFILLYFVPICVIG